MKSDEMLSGVLLVDKGPGMTSHDVVAVTRRCLGMKKVGHCGTLDPMATGLLIVVIGHATRLSDLLMAEDKEYVGTATLGITTSSQDKEGTVEETKPVPAYTQEEVQAAFDTFRGDFYQMPPMVSAIKKEGVPLYKLARQGKTIEREPRFVRVYDSMIKRVALPEIDFRVVCSKGFYVRTYAHDIGQKLGCGAHLSTLRRTRSGHFTLDTCRSITFDDLKAGRKDLAEAALYSLYEVSKLRGV
jgi:tRNA pseudouridine55 synthase